MRRTTRIRKKGKNSSRDKGKLLLSFLILIYMEHLHKYLENKSREDFLAKAGKANSIEVSLKIDGTPLQMYVEDILNNEVSFHSKGSSMLKAGPSLTSLDLFMNPAFYDQVQVLRERSKNNNLLSYVHLLDFEIVVPNDHHIIQYANKPRGNMFLLAGTTTNDKFIDKSILCKIAKTLGVETVPTKTIKAGILKSLCDFAIKHKDYKDESDAEASYVNAMQNSLGKDFIPNSSIEGIVITLHGNELDGLQLKVDSPKFVREMASRKKSKLSKEEEDDIKSILDTAMNLIDKTKLSKWSNDPLENMIINFNKSLADDQDKLREFSSKCESSDKTRKNAKSEAIPEKYRDRASDKDWVIGLQNFVWLFRKQRKGILKDANGYAKAIAGS